MMIEKQNDPVNVVAASFLGPSLLPDDELPWQESMLPLACDDLVQKVLGQQIRRAGRFIKMVCAGAVSCLQQVAPEVLNGSKTGIFLATGLGNGDEILPFVTQVFKHSGGFPSPNQFANSVSNAAAFFLARHSGVKGVILTVSDEELSFESALWLAKCYLTSGEIDLALVGGCDVYTPTVEEYRMRMNALAENSRMLPIGEGSSWLVLGKDMREKIGDIYTVQVSARKTTAPDSAQGDDILAALPAGLVSERKLWLPGFRLKNPVAPSGFDLFDYLPYSGVFPTASAYGLASALRNTPSSLVVCSNFSDSGRQAMVVAVSR